jgi:hypothetical protein
MTFHYASVQSHSMMTPYGKRVKETLVRVENGKGVKMVSVGDHKGLHSDTTPLSKTEMKNIQNHVFMPKLFHSTTRNVMRKKNSTTHRKHKKGTRKSKK